MVIAIVTQGKENTIYASICRDFYVQTTYVKWLCKEQNKDL